MDQVDLLIHVQEGVKFIMHSERHQTFKLCLNAQQTETTYVTLVFNDLGRKKIHGENEIVILLPWDQIITLHSKE